MKYKLNIDKEDRFDFIMGVMASSLFLLVLGTILFCISIKIGIMYIMILISTACIGYVTHKILGGLEDADNIQPKGK